MELQDKLEGPPRAVRWFTMLLLVGFVASALLAFLPLWRIVFGWYDLETGDPSPFEIYWHWVASAILLGIALRFCKQRSPRAPAWALAAIVGVLASMVDEFSRMPQGYGFVFDELMGEPRTLWDRILFTLGIDVPRNISALVALSVAALATRRLLFVSDLRGDFGSSAPGEDGFPGKSFGLHAKSRFGIPTLVVSAWLLFVLFGCLVGPLGRLVPFWIVAEPFGMVYTSSWIDCLTKTWLPFFVAFSVIIWQCTERLDISDEGIRLFLFDRRWTIWFAPWDRIKLIEFMRHGAELTLANVRYRFRFNIPICFGIPFRRYVASLGLQERLTGAATEIGIPIKEMRSSRWMGFAAWAVILCGFGSSIAMKAESAHLMNLMAADPFPEAEYQRLAGLFPLTALYLASVLLVGLGIGMKVGHDRGFPQFWPLVLWLCAVQMLPDPVLHWLVYVAIFSILAARTGTIIQVPHVPVPPYWQTELAHNLVLFSPVLGFLGYMIGVPLARRIVR
ncbi:MAG: hypothetical protein HZC36_04885 [Armatimonadetes bacterium]|nr:hypothetical protein [Armatimonadota bacterium]